MIHPCPDMHNGSINLTITGGLAPYRIHWSGNIKSPGLEDQSGLSAGNYTVTVMDSHSMKLIRNFVLQAFEIKFMKATPGCVLGEVEVSIRNGNSPYDYTWSNGTTNSVNRSLSSGNYSVTVVDAQGCSLFNNIQLQNKEAILESNIWAADVMPGVKQAYHVYNPLGEPVTIHREGIRMATISTETSFLLPKDQWADHFANYDLDIGKCRQNLGPPRLTTALTANRWEAALKLFPNPFNNELVIRKNSSIADQYAIEILDLLGRSVILQNERAEEGMNEYRIQALSKLPLGVYLIKMTSAGGEVWTQKVVKK